ncbi:hypothetical protein ACFOD9_10220 [Novosphingobium bradum]|uniref:GAF domain-containing protein n=1 Tax=Novosphingobium bradum TaxID=1737444 RepID=A0ABV7IWN9_9SPHN
MTMPLETLLERTNRTASPPVAPARRPVPVVAAPDLSRDPPGTLRKLAELAVMFALLLAIDRWALAGDLFAGIAPSPLWVPVLAMAIAYGAGMGLVAAILAAGIWAMAPHPPGPGDHLEAVLRLSIEPMLWIVAAMIIGELTSHRLDRLRRLHRRCGRREAELGQLAEAVDQLGRINRSLQVRIATEERSVGEAIAMALDLVDRGAARQMRAIERLVALAAQTGDFAFYTAEGSRFVARFRGPDAAARPAALSWEELASVVAASAGPIDFGKAGFGEAGAGETGTTRGAHAQAMSFPIFSDDEEVLGVLVMAPPLGAHLPATKLAELAGVARTLGRIAGVLTPATATPRLRSRSLWASEHAA